MQSWSSDIEAPDIRIKPAGWAKIAIKLPILAAVIVVGVILKLLLRLIEAPVFKARRPVTPYITVVVCRIAIAIIGIPYQRIGRPMNGQGAMVANHTSWLDIFVLNAAQPLYFVSKAEVAGWPGIGLLAKVTGTVFIKRDRSEAQAQLALFRTRFKQGHRLLFFPEGTSTDGRRVLPFKPTLFAAFLDDALRNDLSLQPVSVVYQAAAGADVRQYGWWGDMDFGSNLLQVLSQRHGSVTVVYHDPIRVADHPDRKRLAKLTEDKVRLSLSEAGVLEA